MKNNFLFHSDSGHGWLAVKKNILLELDIHKEISVFSYMKGDTAYLEEDCDASIFFEAYSIKFGITPSYRISKSRPDRSPIRSYQSYKF